MMCDEETCGHDELTQWLESAGDLDDFIFYCEEFRQSER